LRTMQNTPPSPVTCGAGPGGLSMPIPPPRSTVPHGATRGKGMAHRPVTWATRRMWTPVLSPVASAPKQVQDRITLEGQRGSDERACARKFGRGGHKVTALRPVFEKTG
jgi:hypothetical protein